MSQIDTLYNKSKEELEEMLTKCKEIERELHNKYYNVTTRNEVASKYRTNQRKAIKIAKALENYDKMHEYVKSNVYSKNIITGEYIKENSVMKKDFIRKEVN